MRPSTHFSIEGWNYVLTNFNAMSGCMYDKLQLKNKWDQLKKEWKLWKDLIGKETGLGWDPNKRTIDASQEWWDEKIKAIPAVAKFQKEGLEPDLVDQLNFMFSDTVATEKHAWTPSSTIAPSSTTPIVDDNLLEEGNMEGERGRNSVDGDSENSFDELMQGHSANIGKASVGSGSKRKISKSGKGKIGRPKLSGAAKLRDDISRLVAIVESRASLNSRTNETPNCSFAEVMMDVKSLPGVEKGSELYYFASLLFEQKVKREGYSLMADPEEKLGWLKYQYEALKGKSYD